MIEGLKLGVIFAVLVELFHFSITVWMTKRVTFKNKVIEKSKPILIFFSVMLILWLIFSGFYIVGTQENVVKTSIGGNKVIMEDTGIKYSFLSKAETFDMRRQVLEYPNMGTRDEVASLFGEEELMTSDRKPVKHTSSLYWKISDLKKFAIESKDTESKLFYELSSLVTKKITTNNYDDLMQGREVLEKEIIEEFKDFEESYGVEILDFQFMRITDAIEIINAKAEADAEKIQSEARLEYAKSEAEAIKEKYNSIQDKEFILEIERLDVLREREGDTVWVISNGEDSNLLLNK